MRTERILFFQASQKLTGDEVEKVSMASAYFMFPTFSAEHGENGLNIYFDINKM